MRISCSIAFWVCLFGLMIGSSGCAGGSGGRVDVSGTVILEGQPLKEGTIEFFPLEQQDTKGGALIVDGSYSMVKKSGLKPGKYLVKLTSGDGKTPASDEEVAAPGGSTNIVSVDMIPEEYNIASTQEREVKAGEVNKFDFNIPKANRPKKK